MEVVRVEPEDWERIRDLRLRALLSDPDAFGSTYEQEVDRDEDAWRSWATGWANAVDQGLFAAVDEGDWVGMALGVRWEEDPVTAQLYAMWVEASWRRRGLGHALVGAVVAWARGLGVRKVTLRVTEENAGARALYERCGFLDTGEREALREASETRTVVMQRSVSTVS